MTASCSHFEQSNTLSFFSIPARWICLKTSLFSQIPKEMLWQGLPSSCWISSSSNIPNSYSPCACRPPDKGTHIKHFCLVRIFPTDNKNVFTLQDFNLMKWIFLFLFKSLILAFVSCHHPFNTWNVQFSLGGEGIGVKYLNYREERKQTNQSTASSRVRVMLTVKGAYKQLPIN